MDQDQSQLGHFNTRLFTFFILTPVIFHGLANQMFWRLGRTLACPSLKPGHCSSEFSSSCVAVDQANLSLKLKLARSARLGNEGKAGCVWGETAPICGLGAASGKTGRGKEEAAPRHKYHSQPSSTEPHHPPPHKSITSIKKYLCYKY